MDKLRATSPAARDTPPALDRRPEAITFSIEQLLQYVLDGRIRVPNFQRGLKWNEADVREFLDSIYRGYPVGTLLF